MIKSRKAESNIIAELMLVGIGVTMSMVVFLAMTNDDIAGDFGSLAGDLEASSEILHIADLAQKCPGMDASVTVKNTGGVDARVKAIAINDATNNTNANAEYPNNASAISLIKGSTSDPLTNTQCNDATYLNIASAFSGTTTDVVSNMNFTSNINGWTSSSSSTGGPLSLKYYLTLDLTSGFGTDYRELSLTADTPNSSTSIDFGDKKGHYLFHPGQPNDQKENQAHNGNTKGYGWRTVDPFDSITADGTWEIGVTLTAEDIEDDADGHIEFEVFSANADGTGATQLFFLHNGGTNVIDEDDSEETITYTFTHTPANPIDLDNKILILESYLHVTDTDNDNDDAKLKLNIGTGSYISVPLSDTITIFDIVHDPLNGNPSPGSGPGSAMGIIEDLTDLIAIGTVDYNFIYQFTTPADFDSMSASYAWSYTETIGATDTKLNYVRLIITDLNGNLVTELHCDDNSAGTCDSSSLGWEESVSFTYRTGIDSTFALSPSTSYRLVVQFQVDNQLSAETATITFRIDDVGLEFIEGEYEASASFTGTSSQASPSNLKLFFDSTFTKTGVDITLQGYDYVLNDYSTTSAGQKNYAFATSNSDYIVNKELDPSKFLNSGQWQFKVTATHPTSFTMSIDLIQMNAVISKPVLREAVYLNNVVIEPGQTTLVNATLSRYLDPGTAYKVTVVTERNSYAAVILN